MEQVKVSIPSPMKDQIKTRTEKLGLSNSEYLRLLATLDISIQRYQNLVTYVNLLYNKINDIQVQLGIYSAPIQEIPTVKLESV